VPSGVPGGRGNVALDYTSLVVKGLLAFGSEPVTMAKRGIPMKYGARNNLVAKVKSVKRGDVMSLVKFEVQVPHDMASVLTTESVDDLSLQVGDTVHLVIKAIHVLTVRE
jgi:molybdopterin-binding protein